MKTLMAGRRGRGKPQPRIVAPGGQWGIVLEKHADDASPGVTVQHVLPQSAAADAGLKVGDRLLTLDGRWTDSVADAFEAAEKVKPGQRVTLELKRGDRRLQVEVAPRVGY
jgi:S1-C subfamily serine protease